MPYSPAPRNVTPVVRFEAVKCASPKTDAVRLQYLNALRRVATQIKADFMKPTKGWKRKPVFEASPSLSGGHPSVTVWTNNMVYGVLNYGRYVGVMEAKPHGGDERGPYKYGLFKWPRTYHLATHVNSLNSYGAHQKFGGSKSTSYKYASRYLYGSTIHPRNWEALVDKKWQKEFSKQMYIELSKAIERSLAKFKV